MAKLDSIIIAGGVTVTKDVVRNRLATETVAVERAILALYAKQTETEKMIATTNVDNGMGFNGTDAFILTKFAKWIKGSWKPQGQKLSVNQLAIARKKLPKYAGQLIRIAHEKGKAVA